MKFFYQQQIRSLIFSLSLFTYFTSLSALPDTPPTVPVDVSILIADLKYNSTQGVQICEIQQGILSIFRGQIGGVYDVKEGRHLAGKNGHIVSNIFSYLTQFQNPYWTTLSKDSNWLQTKGFPHSQWRVFKSIAELEADGEFAALATTPPNDPYNAADYHGLLLTRQESIKNYQAFKEKYPGIILIDAASRKYWIDKYKMSKLFLQNETLSQFKPKWKAYTKTYTPQLANQIIKEIGGTRFVIKPISSFSGHGVLIIDAKDLDTTLKYILTKTKKLKKNTDQSYNHWFVDSNSQFIVEKFAASDLVEVPYLGGELYEPTIRVAFILTYNNHEIQLEFCGAFYRLPHTPYNYKGTLNDKYKDASNKSYFLDIQPEILEKIEDELRIALPLLYEQMLWPK